MHRPPKEYIPLEELAASHPEDFKITQELDETNKEGVRIILNKLDVLDEEEISSLVSTMTVREAVDMLQVLDLKDGKSLQVVVVEVESESGESGVRRTLGEKKSKARYLLNMSNTASGGMASIVHGFDLSMAKPIAIKRLPVKDVNDKTKLLHEEAKSHANSEHHNIVKVFDYLSFADSVQDENALLGSGIVMEGISPKHSPSLDNFTSKESSFDTGAELEGKKVLSPELIRQLLQDMVDVLLYISERRKRSGEDANISQNDIKPANIFLTRLGFKITDFGVSDEVVKAMLEDDPDGNMIVGTPQFFSPETAMGQSLPLESDLYSLTLTIFTLITGNKIYKNDITQMIQFEAMTGSAKDNMLNNINENDPSSDNEDWKLLKQYCSDQGLNFDKVLNFFKIALEVGPEDRYQVGKEDNQYKADKVKTAERYLEAALEAFTPIENS